MVYYVYENNNPSIIIKEKFEAVQIEKENRSNLVKDGNEKQRKVTKFSSKK